VWVKICGITCVEDALVARDAGADAIGLNFVPTSKRAISRKLGRAIIESVRGDMKLIGVVADLELKELEDLRSDLRLDALQLHGSEPPSLLSSLLPGAFKAIHVGSSADAENAEHYPGEVVLVDAKVNGQLGGTGQLFDWSLVRALSAKRKIVLAGGLTSQNVAGAIAEVRPFGVDVASGVERADTPRRKDADKVLSFVKKAKA
jgi:phosphoribosylanthranilate isomerase